MACCFVYFLCFQKIEKRSKSVKLQFYYSTQTYDDLVARYFTFSKREFPQKHYLT